MNENQETPRRFRWEQCYGVDGQYHWALCDTASDARAEKLSLSGMVTCPYMVMHHALPNGLDGRPVPEQDFPKLIVELLNAHFAPKEEQPAKAEERESIVYALEAAWYAMEKHAPELCSREIKTARAILENYGRLPKLPKDEHLCEFSRAMDGTCFVCGSKGEDQV